MPNRNFQASGFPETVKYNILRTLKGNWFVCKESGAKSNICLTIITTKLIKIEISDYNQ